MSLRSGELERVLKVVQDIGQAQTRDQFMAVSLRAVLDLVPCMVVAANEVDPRVGRFVWWHEPTSYVMPDDTAELLGRYAQEQPLLQYILATGDGSARRISDLVTREQFHATQLYQRLYGRMGMEHQMSVTLPAPAPMVFAFVLGNRALDFSDRDRTVMNALRPHLAYIWRNIRDQEQLGMLIQAAADVTAQQGWAVIVLDDPPQELTPGALVTLYRCFGRPSVSSPFPTRVERWLLAQRRVHAGNINSGTSLEFQRSLSAQVEGYRVALRYLPAQQSHPGAIILTQDTSRERSSLESLGLSSREAQVVHLVTTGVTNRAIAENLHVSVGTVRKHLDNVYNKLGVHSRGTLTAFVLNIGGR